MTKKIDDTASSLPKVSLGRTGKQITRFGLGGFHQVEISSEIVQQVVDEYLRCGGNYIETARNYGRGASEEKIGRALSGQRDRVILCSKTGAITADEARHDLELSLEALQTDHIEFYYFHCVEPANLPKITAKGGAMEGLIKAKEEGLIDGMGLSSHWPEVYLDAFEQIPLSLILIWCNYLDNFNFPIIPSRIIPEALRRGIGVTAMKPLADGMLYASAENAVRYSLSCGPEVVVCGANSVQQVRQVAEAVRKGPADDDLRQAIEMQAPELGLYVCRQCGRCPKKLMHTFELEGQFDRQMIDFMPHGPADNALRGNLAHWFHLDKLARAAFEKTGVTANELMKASNDVTCPYGIDVPRKTCIALAKLTGQRPEVV